MKSLFIIFLFILIGCATNKPAYHTKMPHDAVYLDTHNIWINNCPVRQMSYGQCQSPWRSITLRAINKKYRDVDIKVVCSYSDIEFGEKNVTVGARDDKTFTVWGLARSVSEKIICGIVDLK